MDLMSRRRALMMRKPDLPSGYKKLDYIEKNGTIAVITIPAEYCKLAVDDILDIKMSCIMGDGYQCFAGRTALWDLEINNWNADKTIARFGTWKDVFVKTSPASNECIVGNIYDLEYRANTTNAAKGINIGAYNDNGGNYPFYGRFYRVTCKSNGQTILDMIPAKRLSDGKIGMYETVQGAFFSSTSKAEFQEP